MLKKLLFFLFISISIISYSQKSLSKLSAAPNPFETETKIKFESNKDQSIFLTVRNVLGKTVYEKKHQVKKGKNSIPFSKNLLKSGMYIYSIRNNKELISKRLVIK